MSEGSERESRPRGGALRRQRLWLACTLALLAAVLVIAARAEQTGPDEPGERIGRRMDLTELIALEQDRARDLERQVEQLSAEIAGYEAVAVAGSDELAELQELVDELAVPAGLTDVRGSGLVVTLEDSSLPYDTDTDANDLVIHEEDLRAIVNALWAGGAEAISINDSRVLSTSSIRCVGNTLYLNGRLYAPPFVVQAIGDQEELAGVLERDAAVQRFLVVQEEFDLGYEVSSEDDLLVPGHSGLSGLETAVPATGEG